MSATRKPRSPSFTKALTIVRDRLKADPALFDGGSPWLWNGCGCICAHLKDLNQARSTQAMFALYPRHTAWLETMYYGADQTPNRLNTRWAIRALNAKLASLKRRGGAATKRRAAR